MCVYVCMCVYVIYVDLHLECQKPRDSYGDDIQMAGGFLLWHPGYFKSVAFRGVVVTEATARSLMLDDEDVDIQLRFCR